MKLTKTCTRFLRKHGGTILAVAASVGVVATAIETGRATTKAKHLLAVDEALRTYNEDEHGIVEEPPTKKEIVQTCWKAYVPAMILGGGTIACILGSNALNKKQIASLTAGYMALGKAYQEYRSEVAERIGAEEEKSFAWKLLKRQKVRMFSGIKMVMSSGCSTSLRRKDIFMLPCPVSLRHRTISTGNWPRTVAFL